MLNNIIDRIKLPFRKEKELYMSLYEIIGIYPHDISLYKLALMHKSMFKRNAKGKPINNERLEFLGDAILDAAVGDIVYRHFPGKREGFLTNTRSKLVQRDTLNRLAQEMGITKLILSNGRAASHNSYMGGNAFEALVGAIYLDRGYDACMRFIKKRILAQMINIDKVAYKEVNFKSKLIEWTQKNRVQLEFVLTDQHKDKNGSPVFGYRVVIEGQEGCEATGYSKKESQQLASKRTLEKLKKEPGFLDAVFAAKTNRTKMEEMPVETVPSTEQPDDFFTDKAQQLDAANTPTTTNNNVVNNEAMTFSGNGWTAARTLYWDDGTYNVYAYYPYINSLSSIEDQPFSVSLDQTTEKTSTAPGGYEASDLLHASCKGVAASDEPVNLIFRHIMSKLTIRLIKGEDFEGEMPVNATVYVHNTVPEATIDLQAGVATRNAKAVRQTITAHHDGDYLYSAIIVPQRIENRMPLIEVVMHNMSYLYESKFQFKPGMEHLVNLIIPNNPDNIRIEIGGDIKEWQ